MHSGRLPGVAAHRILAGLFPLATGSFSEMNMQRKPHYGVGVVLRIISAITIAAVLGVGTGVAIAKIAPGDKLTWAGLAVVPLWFLLEIVFEIFVGVFGSYSRFARISITIALLLGFYIAWFVERPL